MSDLFSFSKIKGQNFISTGVTHRDFGTLFEAAKRTKAKITVAARGKDFDGYSSNVTVEKNNISVWDVRAKYEDALAGLVVIPDDAKNCTAVGWTCMLDMMSVGLPIIKTRTGPLDEIVNVENIGAGILVEPGNPQALAAAMDKLWGNVELCRDMGLRGAEHVRDHLTMDQFASPLVQMVFDAKK